MEEKVKGNWTCTGMRQCMLADTAHHSKQNADPMVQLIVEQ